MVPLKMIERLKKKRRRRWKIGNGNSLSLLSLFRFFGKKSSPFTLSVRNLTSECSFSAKCLQRNNDVIFYSSQHSHKIRE